MKLFRRKVPKLTNIEVRENFVLRCTFNTGDIRDYDFSHIISVGEAFKPLQDEKIFSTVSLIDGVPTWLDGKIDFDPCCILENGIKI